LFKVTADCPELMVQRRIMRSLATLTNKGPAVHAADIPPLHLSRVQLLLLDERCWHRHRLMAS